MRRSMVVLIVSSLVAGCLWCIGAPVGAQAPEEPDRGPGRVEVDASRPLDAGSPSAPERSEPTDAEALESLEGLVEVEAERTASSRTFLAPDGTFQTMLTTTPINYELPDGSWEEIDNTWVQQAGRGQGGGWTNGANGFEVALPASLAEPFTVEGNGASLSFTAVPPATEAAARADLAGEADGRVVTYPLSPGVSVRYTALSTGLKEEIVLESPDAARRVSFDVAVTGGELRQVGGGLAVVARDGAELLTVPAPFALDADLEEGPAHLTLQRTETGHRLTLAGDDAWLDARDRAWPVVIDPLVIVQGTTSSTDCYISSANPTGRDCSSQFLRAGYESGVQRRSLLRFPDLDFTIPRNSEHVNSMLRLTASSHSNTAGAATLELYKVTQAWDTNLTWQKRDLTNSWTNAGGTFDGTTPEYIDAAHSSKIIGGGSTGSFFMYAHEMVSDWLESPGTNRGFLVAANPFVTNDMVNFRSSEYATGTQQPALWVNWKYRDGMRDASAFEDHQLTDRSNLFVNYANLNAHVAANEFDIQGTGHNLKVTRYYNGRNDATRGWTWSVGADTRLEELLDGSIIYHTARGEDYLFIKKEDGTFFQPPGLNGKLTRASADDYTVTMNKSNFKIRFQRQGDLLVPTRLRDRNNNDILWSYTLNGTFPEIDTITDTQGEVMDVTWTSGRITSIEDWEGRTASYTWSGGHLVTARDAGNADTEYTYDGEDRISTITTPEGRLTTITYQFSDMVDEVQRRLDGSTTYAWQFDFFSSQARTRVTDPNLNTVDYYWTSRDKVHRIVDGLAHQTKQSSFNNNEDATDLTNGTSGVFTYSYSSDGNNNLQSIQSPSTGTGVFTTSFQYNTPSGISGNAYLQSSAMDPQGKCQAFEYDSRGNQVRTFDGATVSGSGCSGSTTGAETEIARNANGTVDHVTSPEGRVTDYGYDGEGNLTTVDHPAPLGTWTYTPDALARVSRVVDGEGQRTDFTFDNLDRVVQITYDGDTGCTSTTTCTTFDYDEDGRLLSRTDGTGTTTFTYDGLGRLRAKALPGGANACSGGGSAITLDYDGFGNLTSYCDAQGTLTYTFDAANRMTGLAEPGGSCTTVPTSKCIEYLYDDDGRQRFVTYPTSPEPYTVEWKYASGSSYITRVTGKKGVTPTYDVSYSYSTGSSDTQLVRQRYDHIAGNLRSYQYDSRNRLCWQRGPVATHSTASCSSPPSGATSYTYDKDGNRTAENRAGTPFVYRYNDANELCWRVQASSSSNACNNPPPGAEAATYDLNGAMEQRSDGFTAAYNPKLQTEAVDHPGQSPVSMDYSDVDSTERTTYGATTFDNGPLGMVRSSTGSDTTTWTRTNDGMLVSQHRSVDSNARHYYLLDRQGSVGALIKPNGDLAVTYSYDAYGTSTTSGAMPNPFRFQGGYEDQARSIKFGTRYYDPVTGRFTQVDPLAGAVADPESGSRYHFATNDPVNRRDPSGYSDCGDGSAGGIVDCVANPTEIGLEEATGFAASVIGCLTLGSIGAAAGGYLGLVAAVATGGTGAFLIPAGTVVGAVGGCALGTQAPAVP